MKGTVNGRLLAKLSALTNIGTQECWILGTPGRKKKKLSLISAVSPLISNPEQCHTSEGDRSKLAGAVNQTQRKQWSDESMVSAIKPVKGGMSLLRASDLIMCPEPLVRW